MLKLLPVFKKYDNLYSYIRLLGPINKKLDNEPK